MDWLAEDPPTWEWEHDPDYFSLRQRRIAERFNEAWAAFVRNSEVRFARFVNTGRYEPR